MKATGIVRKTDSLGRVVLPKELRKNLHIGIEDPVEFFVDGEDVIIRKFDAVADMAQLLADFERKLRAGGFVCAQKKEQLLDKLEEMKAIVYMP